MTKLLILVLLTGTGCSLIFAPSSSEDTRSVDASYNLDAISNLDANDSADAANKSDAITTDAGCPDVNLTLVVSAGGTVLATAETGTVVGSCGPGPTDLNAVCSFCVTQDVAIALEPSPQSGYGFVSFNLACGNTQSCTPPMTDNFTAGASFAVL